MPRQLDDSDVLGSIRKYRKDVQTCLEKQASADPSVQGRMIIKMVIQRNGQPSRVTVQPDRFAASVVGKCMQRSVARWRFPRFSGPSMPVDFPVLVRGQ
ncbi:MAG: AgmX/PglI C-terminal domain-containing protein [Deltaproteobacteria bacterium]|nr:AgmX/PglI C-terminal domain-containing protein [Deltaproteobacteria bacterium]